MPPGIGYPTNPGKRKVRRVMHEFKEGGLRSGSGKKVTDRDQAIAIAISEAAKQDKLRRRRKS